MQGRQRTRWEDCFKRDLERVRGEWRKRAKDRRSWRLLITKVVREKSGEERQDEYDRNHGQPHP